MNGPYLLSCLTAPTLQGFVTWPFYKEKWPKISVYIFKSHRQSFPLKVQNVKYDNLLIQLMNKEELVVGQGPLIGIQSNQSRCHIKLERVRRHH